MSNFTIQKHLGLGELEDREILMPKIPLLRLPAQVTLLNYSVEQLVETVKGWFDEQRVEALTVLKALKIVGCSLGDGKLMASMEGIIRAGMGEKRQEVYGLMALWGTTRFNLSDFLAKLSSPIRKPLTHLLFQGFLLCPSRREQGIAQQLSTLISLTDQKDLITELKKRYEQRGSPLKTTVRKCMQIQTQKQQLREFLITWASHCLSLKVQRLMQFTLEDNRQELEYLIENVPSMSAIFISQVKGAITEENISSWASSNQRINSVLQTAIKEWINEGKNYWSLVDRRLDATFAPSAGDVLTYGKYVSKENLQNECISIKLLYKFFEGSYFHFDRGDAFAAGEKEQWKEVYRSICHCSSYKMINFVVMNKALAPSWWKGSDPRKVNISNKNLKKFLDSHKDYLEQRESNYLGQNKRIELSFSVFIVYDKETGKQFPVTLEQLLKLLQGESAIDYKESLPSSKTELKIREQPRKEHNIIIEAKIVRIIKRSKESMSVEQICKSSGYGQEAVELAMKRLVSKNLAQEVGGKYKYEV